MGWHRPGQRRDRSCHNAGSNPCQALRRRFQHGSLLSRREKTYHPGSIGSPVLSSCQATVIVDTYRLPGSCTTSPVALSTTDQSVSSIHTLNVAYGYTSSGLYFGECSRSISTTSALHESV